MYELQQGKHEAQIIDLAIKTGGQIPEKILNRPVLLPGLILYWRAFWDCSTDRDIGMVEGPLKWSSIRLWAETYEITGFDFDRLVTILRLMDTAFIEERSKQNEKLMKQKSGGKIGNNGPIKTKR